MSLEQHPSGDEDQGLWAAADLTTRPRDGGDPGTATLCTSGPASRRRAASSARPLSARAPAPGRRGRPGTAARMSARRRQAADAGVCRGCADGFAVWASSHGATVAKVSARLRARERRAGVAAPFCAYLKTLHLAHCAAFRRIAWRRRAAGIFYAGPR